jgi:hypothetical protein
MWSDFRIFLALANVKCDPSIHCHVGRNAMEKVDTPLQPRCRCTCQLNVSRYLPRSQQNSSQNDFQGDVFHIELEHDELVHEKELLAAFNNEYCQQDSQETSQEQDASQSQLVGAVGGAASTSQKKKRKTTTFSKLKFLADCNIYLPERPDGACVDI